MEKRLENIEKKIDSLADVVATGFCELNDKINFLEEDMNQRFKLVDKRFEQIDKRFDNIYNILDNHTKLLLENRAERAASTVHFDRLDSEIVKIKRKLKTA